MQSALKKFSLMTSLRRHLNTHQSITNFQCTLCVHYMYTLHRIFFLKVIYVRLKLKCVIILLNFNKWKLTFFINYVTYIIRLNTIVRAIIFSDFNNFGKIYTSTSTSLLKITSHFKLKFFQLTLLCKIKKFSCAKV